MQDIVLVNLICFHKKKYKDKNIIQENNLLYISKSIFW